MGCTRENGEKVNPRPAICDKARKKQLGELNDIFSAIFSSFITYFRRGFSLSTVENDFIFSLIYLRCINEWICSERPITECAIVKAWPCQGSRIRPKCDVTRRQRPMGALVSFPLQRSLHANMRRTRLLGYSPQLACSG